MPTSSLTTFASKLAPTNHSSRPVGRCAVAFDLDLRRPVKPRWPNAGSTERVNRQDAGLAATGQGRPVAAARAVIPERGHTEPRRGAEWWGKSLLVTFGLLSKVTRCKSGTGSVRFFVCGPVTACRQAGLNFTRLA